MYVVMVKLGLAVDAERVEVTRDFRSACLLAVSYAIEHGERPEYVARKAWVYYVPEGEPEDYDGPVCFEAHAEGWIR